MCYKLLKVVVIFSIIPHLVMAVQNPTKPLFFREPGPIQQSTLYIDGSIIELQTEKAVWPIIGSDMSNITLDEFKEMVRTGQEDFKNSPHKILVSAHGPRNGLDIVFTINNPPPGAADALEAVATYLEGIFSDSCTVSIYINFRPLDPGVLGWCMSTFVGAIPWVTTRSSLIADMDDDDSLQNWLPTGSTIPVRYTYGSPTVTDEDVVYFTTANYNAAIGTHVGWAATIEFNTDFTWDYDPSNGIVGGHCFQSVAAHEVGHCLGFSSGADRYMDMDVMDICRFQNTDDGGDYNPDDLIEFQNTARLVDEDDAGAVDDDVNSDLISNEYRMSDGTPYQSAHFKQDVVYAIMQPAQASGETFYPHFYKYPDRDVFDLIGWDCPAGYGFTFYIHGHGSIALNPDSLAFPSGAAVELTAIPDSGYIFDYWSDDLSGEQNPDTVLMDSDKIIQAYFASEYHLLTVNIVGSGSVTKDPDLPAYLHESQVVLTAIPNSGWYFHHWSGGLSGFQNPDTLIMDADKTVTAHFFAEYIAEGNDGKVDVPFLDISPNPSSGKTNIWYQVKDNSSVTIEIYDCTGRLVKDFPCFRSAPLHPAHIIWDGRDDTGQSVSSGVYFLKFVADAVGEAGGFKAIRKLLLMR